jgi:hypothetical protein
MEEQLHLVSGDVSLCPIPRMDEPIRTGGNGFKTIRTIMIRSKRKPFQTLTKNIHLLNINTQNSPRTVRVLSFINIVRYLEYVCQGFEELSD